MEVPRLDILKLLILCCHIPQGIGACGTPPIVQHATVRISSYNSLQIATYRCDSSNGYVTRGNNTIACLRAYGYASWSPVQVSCERVICTADPYLANAQSDFYRSTTEKVTRDEWCPWASGYHYGCYNCDVYRTCSPYIYNKYDSEYGYSSRRYRKVEAYITTKKRKEIYYTGTVRFTCDADYFPSDGSNFIAASCSGNGSWVIESGLKCQGKDCGQLEHTEGLHCTLNSGSTRYPHSAQCECMTGYERSTGSDDNVYTRSCQAAGTWTSPDDGLPTTCKRVTCGAIPTVLFSLRSQTIRTGTRYQDTVTYTCLPGYQFTGTASVSCLGNRQWTKPPQCIRKDCGTPPDIENGHIPRHLYNTTFDSEVQYVCYELGYIMVGSPLIRCSEDGAWSLIPQCHRVQCGESPDVPHAIKSVYGQSYRDKVEYKCDIGYSISSGNETIECQVHGYWSVPPTCKALGCGEPLEVSNSWNLTMLAGTSTGDELIYDCQTGFKIEGEASVICQPNQRWSSAPSCQRVHCGEPYLVSNGKRKVRGHYFNDSVSYNCEIGYESYGRSESFCQEDGHWSVPPECHVIGCGVPPAINKASVSDFEGFTLGQRVEYQCIPGYVMVGVKFIICLADGTWSYPPLCASGSPGVIPTTDFVTDCGDPPVVDKAEMQVTGTSPGSITIYRCNFGYTTAEKDKTIICQSSGYWTLAPICEALSCGEPPLVENAFPPTDMNFTVASTVTYHCHSGYELDTEDSTIVCLPTQVWSQTPDCMRKYCGEAYRVLNSYRTVSGQYFNDTVSYQCHIGFIIRGSEISRCSEDGHWTTPPECDVISCGYPPSIENGRVKERSGHNFGDTAVYDCSEDYKLSGPEYVTCQENGNWSDPAFCQEASTVDFVEQPVQLQPSTSGSLIVQKFSSTTAATTAATADVMTSTKTDSRSTMYKIQTKQENLTEGLISTRQTTTTMEEETQPTLPMNTSTGITILNERNKHDDSVTGSLIEDNLSFINVSLLNETASAFNYLPIASPTSITGSTSQESMATNSSETTTQPNTSTTVDNTTTAVNEAGAEAIKHSTGSYNHRPVIIGCSILGGIAVTSLIICVIYLRFGNSRRQGEHNFIPVDNALYEVDGQVMTVYSFKHEE